MRKLICVYTFILLFLASSGYTAVDKTFMFDANTESDLAGYRIYMSSESGVYTYGEFSSDKIVEIYRGPNPGGTEEVTVHVPNGTWYFVATAFDTEGLESGRSKIELTVTTNPEEGNPPGCVVNFKWAHL